MSERETKPTTAKERAEKREIWRRAGCTGAYFGMRILDDLDAALATIVALEARATERYDDVYQEVTTRVTTKVWTTRSATTGSRRDEQ